MTLATAYVVTFIASFCILVIEIVAGRILAPYVGVSLYTWTSIIGVVLAGISIGAYLGGKLADRYPTRKTLGWLLLLSGIATLSISPVTNIIAAQQFPLSLMLRILTVTTITFFIPSCILGMISPVVVTLAVQKMENVGNVVGKIYAVSTLGSITGTFATGFFLISWMGTRHIILVMGMTLVVTALLWGSLLRSKKSALGVVLLPSLLVWGTYDLAFRPPLASNTYHYTETDYYTIKINRSESADTRTRLEALVLDNLTHSFVNLADPRHIEYRYEKIYADVFGWRFRRDEPFKTLTIGGGGYTFPRYLDLTYQKATVDVVEIDPEITDIVHTHFALPRDTRIRSFNMDGRWFVMNCKDRYDVIFLDAYNDLSIPYHLTTREFAELLKGILTTDGLILTNIIDDFRKGAFLPSYVKTLREVFGPHNVNIISISPDFEQIGISTFIVLAGNGSLDIGSFESFMKHGEGRELTSTVVPEDTVRDFLDKRAAVLLTDDHVPVDNLIAPIFEERFGYNRRNR